VTPGSVPQRAAAGGESAEPLSFVVLSHAVLHDGRDVFGPAHNVVEYLAGAGHPTDLVLHSLSGSGEAVHRSFRTGEPVDERRFHVRGRFGELRENVRVLRRIKPSVVVGVDPLNYAAVWLATLGRGGPLAIYYTADYTTRRFANPALNAAYYRLDSLALHSADVKWSVSRAIFERRAAQGVPERDSVVIPNAPPFDAEAIIPRAARDADSLVCVGMLDPLLDWDLLFAGLALALERRPSLTLHLVGDGPDAQILRESVQSAGLGDAVRFHGFLPHREAIELVSRCQIGFALYSGRASWNVFGDSLKVREYFSRGLPVVSTATHPLASELEAKGAGAVVESPTEVAAAIDRLLEPGPGARAVDAALEFAREADRTHVMEIALENVRAHLARRRR
jgi:glycosyltransferase involved in cell wall biosynthesis